MKLYQAIATAYEEPQCEDELELLVNLLPKGAGIGSVKLSDETEIGKLVFDIIFLHMDHSKTYHKVVVEPDLRFGFVLWVEGPEEEEAANFYIEDVMEEYLDRDVQIRWTEDGTPTCKFVRCQ